MSDDELSRVVRSARPGFEPRPEDKLRLRRALAQKLAVGGLVVGASSGAWGAMSSKLLWATLAFGATGAVWLGMRAVTGTDSQLPATATPVMVRPARSAERTASAHAPAGELPTASAGDQTPKSPAPSVVKPAPASSIQPTSSALAEEAALLLEVRSALRRGEPQQALALLSNYESRFERGLLRQEVHGTRVLALCDLGRKSDALRAARSFTKRWPSSPMTARLSTSCVGDSLESGSEP